VPEDPESGFPIGDDELTALALAADPDLQLPDDAVPFEGGEANGPDLLPDWYMPAPGRHRSRRARVVLATFVVALVALNVVGLCVTYGTPDPVWP
jgi:hypothetical protein